MNSNKELSSNEAKKETPVIYIESNGIKITITFSEKSGESNVKERILELLTDSYEKRICE